MLKKILVVDDEVVIVEILTRRLEMSGYSVVAAYDGDDALDKYHTENPDLIILDILLPRLDGYSVAKKIRNEELSQGKKQVFIIMITTRTTKEAENQGYISGGNAYVWKPFEGSELVEMVGKSL